MNRDGQGISLLLANTEKGQLLLQVVKDSIMLREVPLDKCLQPNLQHPTPINPLRDQFIKDYSDHGFLYIAKKYSDWNLKALAIRKIREIKKYLKTTIICSKVPLAF